MGKDQIIAIAEKQLREGGYSSLNFRKIAEQMQTSKANVHHHYKNKLLLAEAVTKRYADYYLEKMDQMAQQLAPDYPAFLAAVEQMFWEMAETHNSCSVCPCSQILRDRSNPPELLETSHTHFESLLALFKTYAQKSIDAGIMNPALAADNVAIQTTVFLTGLMMMGQNFSSVSEAKSMMKNQLVVWAETLKK